MTIKKIEKPSLTKKSNLLDRVIQQFDTLISLLAISHREVYDLIQAERKSWFSINQESSIPESYKIYKTQIIHSTFILGYSYFEAFLADLIRKIYLSKPKMLPKEKKLKYAEILKTDDYNAILELMIEREIIDLFFMRMEDVVKYFEKKLNLKWTEAYKDMIVTTSYIRNCIIHNLNKVDHRLSEVSTYKVGDIINLSVSEVNSFGLKARSLVRELYSQAAQNYFIQK